jgi:ATP-binding cassette subfamily B (MDR/TAP) protein 1
LLTLLSDVNKIKDGIGDKLGSALQFTSTFVIGVLISLAKGWKLTLVVLAISPLLFASTIIFTKVNRRLFS